MARRKKKKSPDVSQDRTAAKRKKMITNPFLWIGGLIVVAIISFALLGHIPFIGTGSKRGKSFSVQGGETRPVLPPSLFRGMARTAYAAAKKYPEVMDQVFCYCTCDEPPFNHKSLLSCFTDN
ncbi:MAG: hypothetical protein KAJ09_06615, partial [Deltaproteobacteria bacterium]|nr:hypothetical protein [Deltaproteobacteria bacterium]